MQWWRKKSPKSYDEKCIWCREAKIGSDRGAMLLEDLIECCDGKSNPIKFFCADEIRKASDNFNESNYVSELSNSDYKWYSGKNENHHMILIKKAVGSFHGYREGIFCRDIAISSMVSGHKNFLKLIGCCLEFEGPVMVYHGVKKHYQLDPSEQPWEKRMKIAEDIATALAYLHTAFPRPFVYRTMSLGKILLDEDGVAKLSDFSFCVSIPEGETFVQVDRAVGLYSYMDYKYLRNGVVSEKTDVFAMGILVKTLLTGKERFWEICVVEEEADGEGYDDEDSYDSATMSEMNDPGRHFQFRLLQCKEERRRDEIADPKMLEKMGEISEQELCQMKAFRMLSLRCISRRGEVPTMVEVAKELKKIERSLRNDSSSPSGETLFDSAQDFIGS